jgi:hypothetical protein
MNDQTTNKAAQTTNEQGTAPPLYISPTLKNIDVQHRPEPSPACETCPASVWFSTSDQLKCYCSRMHLIVWEAQEPPILKCDGRELAILALLESQNG